jgi:hypothetical protein
VFVDIVGRVLTYNYIIPTFDILQNINLIHLIFLDPNKLDISGWDKVFVDIINICNLGISILLFFDDPKKISVFNYWN